MGLVYFRQGNIFEGGVDLTVLPCSAKGTTSTATKKWQEIYGIPAPEDIGLDIQLGQISDPIPFPASERTTKYIVYAASVLNNASSYDTLRKIGENLGRLTFSNREIRIIESPLLGTGAGGLDAAVAGEALYKGFKPTSVSDSSLYIFVFDQQRLKMLEKVATEMQASSDKISPVTAPRIFISHSSKDVDIARRLVDLLEITLDLKDYDIRCTSVPGYTLPAGAAASTHLREEIQNTELVLGIVSPESLKSAYVLFELGASWGLRKPTFPLLMGTADFKDLPGPFKDRHSLRLDVRSDIYQLLDDLVATTTIQKRNNIGQRAERLIRELVGN